MIQVIDLAARERAIKECHVGDLTVKIIAGYIQYAATTDIEPIAGETSGGADAGNLSTLCAIDVNGYVPSVSNQRHEVPLADGESFGAALGVNPSADRSWDPKVSAIDIVEPELHGIILAEQAGTIEIGSRRIDPTHQSEFRQ